MLLLNCPGLCQGLQSIQRPWGTTTAAKLSSSQPRLTTTSLICIDTTRQRCLDDGDHDAPGAIPSPASGSSC
ncbi:MAG: hypothetical protein FRX48_08999 [Lasallia pustulata]|uniref:Uncharacterized protein n=1 Tax=Lasallia pustulata TaxID=136370 RepID=A0A5M8PD07_9LECA|nr:MAG: hypothetical protein FRX48_08999 [Lasallia pustulata]